MARTAGAWRSKSKAYKSRKALWLRRLGVQPRPACIYAQAYSCKGECPHAVPHVEFVSVGDHLCPGAGSCHAYNSDCKV